MDDFWLQQIVRPNIWNKKPYAAARHDLSADAVHLDANEFPYPSATGLNVNRYVEQQPVALVMRWAEMHGVKNDQVLLTRGLDEGIDLLVRTFCSEAVAVGSSFKKESCLVCDPSFSMYRESAEIQNIEVLSAQRNLDKGGQMDVKAILAQATPQTKLIFVVSPSVPDGTLMRDEDVIALCKERMGKSIVVLDEAYIKFSSKPDGMLYALQDNPNLVILRGVKDIGLSGERVGSVIGHSSVIREVRKSLTAYPFALTTVLTMEQALSRESLERSQELRKTVISERNLLAEAFSRHPNVEKVFPSEANFLLIKARDLPAFLKTCEDNNIKVRDRNKDYPGSVRISVGTPEENDRLLKAFGISADRPGARAPAPAQPPADPV